MKISSGVSDLLYRHDCVIVSGLGGFIAQYRPASINTSLHVISPPAKKIAFNAFLQMNDGLLATYIARKSGMDYNTACREIDAFVSETIGSMQKGHKVKIDRVGTLYFDPEKNIQFLPDQQANFLVSSFGLTPVHAPLVKRVAEPSGRVVPLPKPAAQPVVKRIRTKKRTWRILEIIPAAAIVAFLMISPPVLNNVNQHLSTLVPFSRINEFVERWKGDADAHAVHFTPVRKARPAIPVKNLFDIPPAHPSRYQMTESQGSLSGAAAAQLPQNPAADAAPASANETASPAELPAPDEFHVIGGCFRSMANADAFISQVSEFGFRAHVVGQNNAGLYMVSLFSSSSKAQAEDALNQVRAEHIREAWLAEGLPAEK